MLYLLQQARDSHFDKFVQIAGGDGEELDSLQQRVAFVQRFFEHPAVESQPGLVAIEVVARIAQAGSGPSARSPPGGMVARHC